MKLDLDYTFLYVEACLAGYYQVELFQVWRSSIFESFVNAGVLESVTGTRAANV